MEPNFELIPLGNHFDLPGLYQATDPIELWMPPKFHSETPLFQSLGEVECGLFDKEIGFPIQPVNQCPQPGPVVEEKVTENTSRDQHSEDDMDTPESIDSASEPEYKPSHNVRKGRSRGRPRKNLNISATEFYNFL